MGQQHRENGKVLGKTETQNIIDLGPSKPLLRKYNIRYILNQETEAMDLKI